MDIWRERKPYAAAWRCYEPVDHMEEAGVDTLRERKLRGSLEELSTTVDHIEEDGQSGYLEGEETV